MQPFRPLPAAGSPPYVIAHRGISVRAPENTLASFNMAASVPGIDLVELDVQLSRDDKVIVLHDRTLQRTTTGNGPARSYTVAELKQWDAGSWFDPSFADERIPTLRETLMSLKGSVGVNIELKSHVFHREPEGLLERLVVNDVQESGMADTVLYSSFDHRMMAVIRRMAPGAVTGVLYNIYRDFGRLPSKLAGRVGASVFVCGKRELSPAMLRDAREHGLAVYVYTLNAVADVRRMLQLGVDGIISDAADDIVPIVKPNRP